MIFWWLAMVIWMYLHLCTTSVLMLSINLEVYYLRERARETRQCLVRDRSAWADNYVRSSQSWQGSLPQNYQIGRRS